MKSILFLTMIFSSISALAAYKDEDASKFKGLSIQGENCKVTMSDLSDGLTHTFEKLETVQSHYSGPRDGSDYASISKFRLGDDGLSEMSASVQPMIKPNGSLYIHIFLERSHEYIEGSNVELIGSQITSNKIVFHGWTHKEFDWRDNGKQFEVTGYYNNGVFKLDSRTEDLSFNIQCNSMIE